jgi:hypothetical protein
MFNGSFIGHTLCFGFLPLIFPHFHHLLDVEMDVA